MLILYGAQGEFNHYIQTFGDETPSNNKLFLLIITGCEKREGVGRGGAGGVS